MTFLQQQQQQQQQQTKQQIATTTKYLSHWSTVPKFPNNNNKNKQKKVNPEKETCLIVLRFPDFFRMPFDVIGTLRLAGSAIDNLSIAMLKKN
jgi:hypothetical protein